MSRDNQGEFKSFLQSLGYDGVMYVEEIREDADITKTDEFTRAVTIFEPNQVKLADGRNTEFSALNNDIRYEKGGLIAPNGKESNLTPEQYKLVRTPEFKKWFGDWENDRQNSGKVSGITKEPSIFYHSTKADFLSKKGENVFKNPPFYFSFDKDVSKEIVKIQHQNTKGKIVTKEFFVKYKNPFDLTKISILNDDTLKNIVKRDTIYNTDDEIRSFELRLRLPNNEKNTWYLTESKDVQDYIKSKGYDSFIVYENGVKNVAVFEPNQIKLADGTNTTFNSESNNIRYAEGGKTKMDRYEHLLGIQKTTPKFAEGGSVATEHGLTNSGKRGGYFEGRSHAEGGIKAWNSTTNSPLEVEGGEVIITKKAVDDDELYEFEGEMLTNKQILSKINESGGGVKFEDGGEIHQCNCSGKMYKYGGETMEDYQIMNRINSTYNKKQGMKNHKTSYGHNLMRKMKEGGYC